MNRKFIRRLDLGVAGGVVLIAGIVCLTSFVSSKTSYSTYEKQYYEEVEALEREKPHVPESVYIDDEFVQYDEHENIKIAKTQFTHIKTIKAAEAGITWGSSTGEPKIEIFDNTSIYGASLGGFDTIGGGEITFTINLIENSDADVTLNLACAKYDGTVGGNTSIDDLSKYIKITLDGLNIDLSNIALDCADKSDWFNFHTLVFDDLHFKKGENTIVITSLEREDGNPVIPNMTHMHVFSEKEYAKQINVNGDTMQLLEEEDKVYLTFSGACSGYREAALMMDLCKSGSSYNEIVPGAYTCVIRDGRFLMKIDCSMLPKARLYTHFFVDGRAYETGRPAGDIMTKLFTKSYGNNWDNPATIQTIDNYVLLCQNAQMVLDVI